MSSQKMVSKRTYNLETQRITRQSENLSMMCVCIALVLFVICGTSLAILFTVKSVAEEKSGNAKDKFIAKSNNTNYTPTTTESIDFTHDEPITPEDEYPDLQSSSLSSSDETTQSIFKDETVNSASTTVDLSADGVTPRTTELTDSDVELDTLSSSLSNEGTTESYSTDEFSTHISNSDSTTAGSSAAKDTLGTTEYTDCTDGELVAQSSSFSTEGATESTSTDGIITTISNSDSTTSHSSTADTTEATETALNQTGKPCNDFYLYACDDVEINHFKEFTEKNRVVEDWPDMRTLDVAVPYKKLYYDFFTSCTTSTKDSAVVEVSKLLNNLCQGHKDNLTDLIADIILLHPQKSLSRFILPIFDVVMEVGPQKTMIPTVGLPKLNSLSSDDNHIGLYERSCLRSAEIGTMKNVTLIQGTFRDCIQDQEKYWKNFNESFTTLKVCHEHEKTPYNTKKFIIQNIEDKFGFISEGELYSAKYETVHLDQLKSEYPEIEWNNLFERFFGEEVTKDITKVRLTHSTYLKKIFKFYSSHSYDDIKRSILSMMAHDLYIEFIEPFSTNDRYKYCLNTATQLMPDIASMLYLENFNQSDIENVEQKLKPMFEQIIFAFNASLDRHVKKSEQADVAKKVSELNILTNPFKGFTKFEDNYRKLYGAVNITENDFISNVLALKRVMRRRMYDTNGKSATSSEIIWNYLASPLLDSPVRITETSTIVLPTNLIAKFTSESQKSEEFSIIGFLVAQELFKLFLDQNVDFERNAETHAQASAYNKMFNMYGIQLSKEDLKSSQHSRFVDDEALRATFDAYSQSQNSSGQLKPGRDDSISKEFYLLTSQQFCTANKSLAEVAVDLIRSEILPNNFRVNSMMMNSESFPGTFKCGTR